MLEATEGEQTQRREWEEGTQKEKDLNRNEFFRFTDVKHQSQIISYVLGAISKEWCHRVKMWRQKKTKRSSVK